MGCLYWRMFKDFIWIIKLGYGQLSFSQTVKLLASGSNDESIKIWDIKTGECLKTLKWQ